MSVHVSWQEAGAHFLFLPEEIALSTRPAKLELLDALMYSFASSPP